MTESLNYLAAGALPYLGGKRWEGQKAEARQARHARPDLLDKPIGMTSTHAVSVIERLFSAERGVHAGRLDPLASVRCRSRSAERPRPSPS